MPGYVWTILVHLSCLLASLFGTPKYMSLSAWQWAREREGRWNLHRPIDWLFFALAREVGHCQDAWEAWTLIAASVEPESDQRPA